MTDDALEAADPTPLAPSGVICVVLAAGSSTRMGGRNKLLEPVDGAPMVATVVRAALASRADEVVVAARRAPPTPHRGRMSRPPTETSSTWDLSLPPPSTRACSSWRPSDSERMDF